MNLKKRRNEMKQLAPSVVTAAYHVPPVADRILFLALFSDRGLYSNKKLAKLSKLKKGICNSVFTSRFSISLKSSLIKLQIVRSHKTYFYITSIRQSKHIVTMASGYLIK